ncbi:MAG: gliding motility-associated C-terminal domain-containing protein [Bacteroidaceae bacterium]|nr:gliding motility-associated C-terminal domain-containing protein [Bacteroidaceae bacterium]
MLRKLMFFVSVVIGCVAVNAVPRSRAYILIQDRNGSQDTLFAGQSGSVSYEAPLHVVFDAGISGDEPGMRLFCQWRVTRTYTSDDTGMTENYLSRQDLHTEYDFNDDGVFSVEFAYSYMPAGSSEVIAGDEQAPISFSIDVSDLYVPNAFSPNDDGKNDVFKVRVKSIVSFSMVIVNRWGQVVASGNQDNLEYENGDDNNGYYICWDGKSNGKTVPDGAYFIHIEAEGAGGRHYTRKSDINILTGLGLER